MFVTQFYGVTMTQILSEYTSIGNMFSVCDCECLDAVGPVNEAITQNSFKISIDIYKLRK